MSKKVLLLTTIVGLFIFSCNNEEGKITDNTPGNDRDSLAVIDTTGDMKVYTLPAPLQIATALKLSNVRYSEKLLVINGNAEAEYTSIYYKALNLGVLMIDLGYTTVYNQRQTSLNYVKRIKKLMEELNITSTIQRDMVTRFEANLQNQDSLYQIILGSYSKTHEYFKENQMEDVGLFILCGSFTEGLYFSLNSKNELSDSDLQNLVAQQKLFLNNIIELLEFLPETNDVKDIKQKMRLLKKEYDSIYVTFDDMPDRIKANTNITPQQINSLLAVTAEVRNKIINP